MKKTVTLWFILMLAVTAGVQAQVSITTDGSDPDASAMLDVKSTTGGLLIPRMTNTGMNAIPSPATGLLVYNTTDNNFYFFNGSAWNKVVGADDNDWTVTGSNMYSAVSGNVGIGISGPTEKLHVNGNMRLTGALRDGNNDPGANGQILSSTGTGIDWVDLPASLVTGTGTPTQVTFWSGANTLSGNSNLYWDNSNNRLGIGTSTPETGLTVYSVATLEGVTLQVSDNTFSQGLRFCNSGGAYTWHIFRKDAGSNHAHLVFANGASSDLSTLTDRVTFADGGNVGIGTGTPSQPLHVNGNMRLTGAIYDVNNQTGSNGQFLSSTGTGVDWVDLPSGLVTGSGTATRVAFWNGSSSLSSNADLYWDNTSGRLGVGIIVPTHKMMVSNTSTDDVLRLTGPDAFGAGARLNFGDSDFLYLDEDEDDKLYIYARLRTAIMGGNVGINTDIPTHDLHVNGTMRLTGGLYDIYNTAGVSGQVLSSTGSGIDWMNLPSLPSDLVTGTGTATRVAFWSGTNTLSSNSNLYWDNSNSRLGINDASPEYNLDVEGTGSTHNGYFSNSSTTSGATAVYAYHSGAGTTNGIAAIYGRAYGSSAANSYGVAGHNYYSGVGVGAWSYSGDLVRAYSGDFPGGTLRFYVNQSGQVYADGGYNTFKETGDHEYVAVSAVQSPESLIEDCGSADLLNGNATVNIDEKFSEIASTGNDYQVFVTPVSDDFVLLVVHHQSSASFQVKGITLDGKPAGCRFHYRIVARDSEREGTRFEKMQIPEEVVVVREE